MKQIDVTLTAFTQDGLLKDGYEVRYADLKLLYVRLFNDRITVVTEDGSAYDDIDPTFYMLTMYRRTRTAEEVAKEERDKWIDRQTTPATWTRFDDLSIEAKRERVDLVQAGMDEMT